MIFSHWGLIGVNLRLILVTLLLMDVIMYTPIYMYNIYYFLMIDTFLHDSMTQRRLLYIFSWLYIRLRPRYTKLSFS